MVGVDLGFVVAALVVERLVRQHHLLERLDNPQRWQIRSEDQFGVTESGLQPKCVNLDLGIGDANVYIVIPSDNSDTQSLAVRVNHCPFETHLEHDDDDRVPHDGSQYGG